MRPTTSARHRRIPRATTLVALLVAVTAAACAQAAPDAEVTAGAPAPAPAEAAAPLPTLPPIDQRQPEGFVDGCAATGAAPDCSVRADDIDANQAGASESDWRLLAGFSGTRWSEVATGRLVVLDDTLTVHPGTTWRASGLVRNERAGPVGETTVAAQLRDAAGAVLADATAVTPVAVLRPGEPAPFEITAPVDPAAVAAVTWTVSAPDVAGPVTGRDVELGVLWERAAGSPEPVDLYLYADPAGGDRPLVVFAQATATAPVAGLRVVGAWIGADGRVLHVGEARVARPEGLDLDDPAFDPTALPAPDLSPGETADVVLTAPQATGSGLVGAQLLMWGFGA